jgi:hypothetical protein
LQAQEEMFQSLAAGATVGTTQKEQSREWKALLGLPGNSSWLSPKTNPKVFTDKKSKRRALLVESMIWLIDLSQLEGGSGNPHSFPSLGMTNYETTFRADMERTSPPTDHLCQCSVLHKELH